MTSNGNGGSIDEVQDTSTVLTVLFREEAVVEV